MNEGRTVFAQLLDFLPKYEFDKSVARHRGNFRCRKVSAYEQFLILAFAQLTGRESLRDIKSCLESFSAKPYHSGIRQPVACSTLADANEDRDWAPLRRLRSRLSMRTGLSDNATTRASYEGRKPNRKKACKVGANADCWLAQPL